ncbi:DUF2897 family protein [Thalassotalea piscium]
MSLTFIFIIILAVSLIIGGIMLLKQSAKKFNLTDDQLKKINERNKELEKEETDD